MNAFVREVSRTAWHVPVRRAAGACLLLAVGIGAVVTTTVHAQGGRRSRQELVAKLEGRPVIEDRTTRLRRAITATEAAAFVDRIAILTAPAASAGTAEALARGGSMVRLSDHGPGHVVVSRPNADGSVSARCVTSVDEAVDFLAGELDDALPVQ